MSYFIAHIFSFYVCNVKLQRFTLYGVLLMVDPNLISILKTICMFYRRFQTAVHAVRTGSFELMSS